MTLFIAGRSETARLQLARAPRRRVDTSDNLVIETDIPARLDRLPWGSFHTLVVVGLGLTWTFNVTLASPGGAEKVANGGLGR